MGCRCSKPEIDSFEREERFMLEHAAQAEKVRAQLEKALMTFWEKEGGDESEICYKFHCKIYKNVVPSLSKAKWRQYLTRRTLDVIMNTAHRKGVWDDKSEQSLKDEAGKLVIQHLQALEGKESSKQFWRLIVRDQETILPEKYATEFSQKFNSVLESIYRIVVHHVITFHLQNIVRKEEITTRTAPPPQPVCTSITEC
mmetsp:Transcript_877/g.1130  ORF Transcript_877/g.1130 Transcript_877/m.1130 type:complete len:199 (+) Transcript_877:140-736(+)